MIETLEIIWLVPLVFWAGYEIGHYAERKSWERQSLYDTPRCSGGEFYYVEKEEDRYAE